MDLLPVLPDNIPADDLNDLMDLDDDDEDVPVRLRRPPVQRERFDYYGQMSDKQFKSRFRLEKTTVVMILGLISAQIEPRSMRNYAISGMNRLLLTLRFLATGMFFIVAGDNFGVSKTAAHDIVQLVIKAILGLRTRYIKFPDNERRQVVKGKFYQMAHFPRVIGVIDCTHIRVQCPGGDEGHLYLNRKGWYSKNVQVIGGPNLYIYNIVTRWPGRFHDMTVFNFCRARYMFESNQFGTDYLLGDGGYECRKYLLVPVRNPVTQPEVDYNTALSKTRVTVERLFGVWKRRFPILSMGIRVSPNHTERIDNYIVAAAVLHNIAVLERDPEPDHEDEDMGEELEQPEDIYHGEEELVGDRRDRLSVRDNIIRNHFT